jgi:hypothetical protein
MAKKLLTSYSFTPGAANAGTVVVSGSYALEQFLLITNVTTGAVIYQFNKPSKGGAVSTGGGNTTLTLEADTSAMSAGDRLQVFVDDGQNAQVSLTNASVEISNDVGNAVPVSAASLPLPSGAATSANQSTANASLSSIDGKLPALSSGRVPVDVGTSINVGEVEVKNDTGNPVPISASSLPLPSGAATETTLASVNGKLPALDTGAVPVLVKNGQLEIQNDTGNPIPVGPAATLQLTGSASANNTDLFSVDCSGYRSINFQITGTWSGIITFQVSNDNITWNGLGVFPAAGAGATSSSTAANGAWFGPLGGFNYARIRFTTYTSGTASVVGNLLREPVSSATSVSSATVTVGNIAASTASSNTTLYTVNSAATTNAASIKATGANLYGISVMNASASTKYVRFFNRNTAPTVGTDVPIMVVAVPATSSKEIEYVPAIRFGTGLAVAITGGAAVTDNTAVAAGDVQLLVSYA